MLADAQANVNGSDDGVSAAAGTSLGLSGNDDTVNLQSSSGSLVNLYGSGTNATINGSGDTVGICGSGEAVTTSGNTINTADSTSSFNLSGGDDTVNLCSGAYVGLLGGSGYQVNAWNGNATINTWDNTSFVVNGSGDFLNPGGSNAVAVYGVDNQINEISGNDSFALYGSGDTVNLISSSGSLVNLYGNSTSATVNGSGNTVGVCASGEAVTTSGNTINTADSTSSFNLSGSNDTVNLASGAYVGLLGGSGYQVNAGNATINTWDNTSFVVNGSGDSVGAGAGNAISVYGDGNQINAGTGSSVLVNGASNTINASGCTIVLGSALDGQTVYIDANDDDIDADFSQCTGTTIIVNGTGNSVFSLGNTVDFSGSNNQLVGGNVNVYGSGYSFVPDLTADPLLTDSSYDGGSCPLLPGISYSDDGGSLSDGSSFDDDGSYSDDDGSYSDDDGSYFDDSGMDDDYDDMGSFDMDPVILNLSGGAVETTSLTTSPASFDVQSSGQAIQTAWGTAGEGYLVFDPNDPGNTTAITQDSQLVGGFDALQSLAQTFDGSDGGTLDASDALWNNLKVWVDTTGTGQFENGQLYSLGQLGITSINLDGVQVDQDNNGNQILVDSTFTRADGSTGNIAGVSLMYSANGQTTASLADLQVQNLVSSMASFGADTSAVTTSIPIGQNDPTVQLAASA